MEIGYIAFLHSVEFYVLMTVAAAAAVALMVKPGQRGAAVLHSVEGWLCEGSAAPDDEPVLHVECTADGRVLIRRTALPHLGAGGTVSLSVTQTGFDLEIAERTVAQGRGTGAATDDAVFALSFLAPERYHVRYTNQAGDRFAAFSLNNRPGLRLTVPLRQ